MNTLPFQAGVSGTHPTRRRWLAWASLVIALVFTGAVLFFMQTKPPSADLTVSAGGADQSFVLHSPDVTDGGPLPKDYTGDGTSATLPLDWKGEPEGTKSFAVIMHHIAPDQTKWYWILYNIPPSVHSLPKNVHGIGTLGNNSINGRTEYAPPHSKGSGPKTYIYTVYALSALPTITMSPNDVNRSVLLDAMKNLILAQAQLHVVYTRFPEPDHNRPDDGGPFPPPGAGGFGGPGGPRSAGGMSVWIPFGVAGMAAVFMLMIGPRLAQLHWLHRTWLPMVAILVLIVGHFCAMLFYFEPGIGTPDASGYYVQTRLIATQGQTWFDRQSPLQYVNEHWLNTGADRYFSQYPPGLSIISATVYRAAGPTAALLVNPVLASLTLLGLFLLGQLWIGVGWGLLAAVLMAVNPVANEHALSCDSHTAVAFLLVWGMYLLALWSQKPSLVLALLSGLALGSIPTIRYPEILFLLAAGLFMLVLVCRNGKLWRSLLVFLLAALLPIGCLLVRNQLAFGAFWKTGYSLTNEQTDFGLDSLRRKALPYLAGFVGEGTGLVACVGLIALIALCINRQTRRQGWLIVSLIIPITLVYMAYGWRDKSLRFLIPIFFLYSLAAMWGIKMLANWWPRAAWAIAAGLVAGVVGWGMPRTVQQWQHLWSENGSLAKITRVMANCVTPGNIVIADPRIQQQLDYAGQWKLVDESLLTGIDSGPGGPPPDMGRRFGEDGLPPDANMGLGKNRPPPDGHGAGRGSGGPRALHEQDRRQILWRYSDRQGPELSGLMLQDLDAWRGGQKIYWIGNLSVMQQSLPQSDQLREVAKIPATVGGRMRPHAGFDAPIPFRGDNGELSVVEWIRSTGSHEIR